MCSRGVWPDWDTRTKVHLEGFSTDHWAQPAKPCKRTKAAPLRQSGPECWFSPLKTALHKIIEDTDKQSRPCFLARRGPAGVVSARRWPATISATRLLSSPAAQVGADLEIDAHEVARTPNRLEGRWPRGT